MIRYLKGIYSMTTENGIVCETASGIGFEISIPAGSPLYKYSEGDEIMVFTEMIVREDDISLFGFHNRETLDFFKLLTTVSGIGPKGAMAIIGSMPIDALIMAISTGDVKTVCSAQGVGKKTAERIIIELRDKVQPNGLKASEAVLPDSKSIETDERKEAISALIALGYTRSEAFNAVSNVAADGLSAEEYTKMALRNLF